MCSAGGQWVWCGLNYKWSSGPEMRIADLNKEGWLRCWRSEGVEGNRTAVVNKLVSHQSRGVWVLKGRQSSKGNISLPLTIFVRIYHKKFETRPSQKFWKSSELWGIPREGFTERVICHLLLYAINSPRLSGTGRVASTFLFLTLALLNWGALGSFSLFFFAVNFDLTLSMYHLWLEQKSPSLSVGLIVSQRVLLSPSHYNTEINSSW